MFEELERVYAKLREALGGDELAEPALEGLRATTLFALSTSLAERAGLSAEPLRRGLLFQLCGGWVLSEQRREELAHAAARVSARVPSDRFELAHCPGAWLDRMAQLDARGGGASATRRARANAGSFFTPGTLARRVIESAGQAHGRPPSELRILDPAAGGGAFLLEAARFVFDRSPGSDDERRRSLRKQLHGVDASRLACATLEAALHVALALPSESSLVPVAVGHGDALTGSGRAALAGRRAGVSEVDPDGAGFAFDRPGWTPEGGTGFDWVVGNPPWVAYQGRATRPLAPEKRRYFRARYRAFSGYPTLQAMFVERATELAPRGVVTLLLPSSLADLDGYAPMREVLTETHSPCVPLVEFGEDAFDGVVQPCFALVAVPRGDVRDGSRAPWALRERQRAGEAPRVEGRIPPALLRLREGARLPRELFGELGFQTNRFVTEKLLTRTGASSRFSYPLLEGKDVREFSVREPRVHLDPDRVRLAEAKVRLRPEADYAKARFVVRQTAAFPIAALHTGVPFRNSLLAGFESDQYSAPLLVALLNSTLLRAYHLASQRDARQRTFPQLKVAHLRALPAPLREGTPAIRLAALALDVSKRGGVTAGDREALDELACELYGVRPDEAREVRSFFEQRTGR